MTKHALAETNKRQHSHQATDLNTKISVREQHSSNQASNDARSKESQFSPQHMKLQPNKKKTDKFRERSLETDYNLSPAEGTYEKLQPLWQRTPIQLSSTINRKATKTKIKQEGSPNKGLPPSNIRRAHHLCNTSARERETPKQCNHLIRGRGAHAARESYGGGRDGTQKQRAHEPVSLKNAQKSAA